MSLIIHAAESIFSMLAATALAATLVAIVAMAAALVLRANSMARVIVWRTAAIALLAIPLLSFAPLEWTPPALRVAGQKFDVSVGLSPQQFTAAAVSQSAVATPSTLAERSGAGTVTTPGSSSASPWRAVLVVIWLAGVLALVVHLAACLRRLERVARSSQSVSDDLLAWARTQLPAARRPGLRIVRGGSFSVPVCWGIRRATILLPRHSDAWTEAHLRTVLNHELIHAARHDSAHVMLARLAVALYWYNPLAWRVHAALVRDTEEVCDEMVLRAGVSQAQYAHVLLDSARDARRYHGYGAVTAFARPGSLERRIERVLAGRRGPAHPLAGLVAAMAVIATMVAATFAAPPPPPTQHTGASATQTRQENIVGALIKALADPSPAVRRSVVNSLRHIGDARGVEAVRRVLNDPDPDVRIAAEIVLGMRAPRPNMQLPPAAPPRPASDALLDSLAAQLEQADDRGRLAAAQALGNLGDERSTAALTARLSDQSARVRAAAAAALGNVSDASATRALIRAWPDPDDHVRASIASALGSIGDPRGTGVVIAALSDQVTHVRSVAAEALGKLGSVAPVSPVPPAEPLSPPLSALAAPAEPDAPATAIPADPPPLPNAPPPRPTAVAPAMPSAPPMPAELPEACAPSFAAAETSINDAVVILLRDSNSERRREAARAIGRFSAAELSASPDAGTKGAYHALEAALSDPAMQVRIAAACSLARVGDGRALAALQMRSAAREPAALRQAARWAIRNIEERIGTTKY